MRTARRSESLRRRVKSRHGSAPQLTSAAANDNAPLSYRVYDLAALEARENAIRVARRSMIAIKAQSPWRGPKHAFYMLSRACIGVLEGPRPRSLVPLKVPFAALVLELSHWLEEAHQRGELRKIGVRVALGTGGALLLLSGVLFFAGLPDDPAPRQVTARIEAPPPPPAPPPARRRVAHNDAAEIFIP